VVELQRGVMDGDGLSVAELRQQLRDMKELVERQHEELIKKVTPYFFTACPHWRL